MGVMYMLMGWDMARKEGLDHFTGMAMNLYTLADGLYKSRDYREAVKYNLLAIRYRIQTKTGETDTLTKYWAMNTWNNLGLCYERLTEYDSAFLAFNHAYALSDDSEENIFWRGLIKGNRGDVFFLQGQYDSAAPLLQFDYERSLATRNSENASMSLQRLARIKNSTGDHAGALKMLREAQRLIQPSGIIDYHMSILEAMAIVFRDMGQADSAFAYLEASRKYQIMTENNAAQNRMDIVKLRMNNEQNIHRILQLSREKNRIKLIRNFIITLAILGAAFGFLYFNRQKLKMRLRQQEALEAKKKAEAEAKNASEQLNIFTHRVLEKTNLVEKLQDELKQRELNEEQLHYINELSQHSILTDADWEQFKNLFEKVYPGFFIRLKNEVPDITLAEQRMAALSKLQVSAKEAATLLGISPNSVNKTRSRLRQRLGLDAETDLETYFSAVAK
jgi:tetratricopeptide (TPR) repeat protein